MNFFFFSILNTLSVGAGRVMRVRNIRTHTRRLHRGTNNHKDLERDIFGGANNDLRHRDETRCSGNWIKSGHRVSPTCSSLSLLSSHQQRRDRKLVSKVNEDFGSMGTILYGFGSDNKVQRSRPSNG